MTNPIERAVKKMAERAQAPRPAIPTFNAPARVQAQKTAFDPWVFVEDIQRFVHRGDRRQVKPREWRHLQPKGLVGPGGWVVNKVRRQIIPVRRFQSVVWEPESSEFPRPGSYNLYRPEDGQVEPDWKQRGQLGPGHIVRIRMR